MAVKAKKGREKTTTESTEDKKAEAAPPPPSVVKPPPTVKVDYDGKGNPSVGYSRLQNIVVQLGRRKGIHTAATLDRALSYRIRKIQTGIFALDWLTGGGFPLDRITRIGGPKNAAKTTTMLKTLANAQTYCRMCACPIVISPKTGNKDCECPKHRFKLVDSVTLERLKDEDVYTVLAGGLPTHAGKEGDKVFIKDLKGKRVYLEETYRCIPFQSVYVETEHKLDEAWARANGVDTKLVAIISSPWAEPTIDTTEAVLYTGEVDLVFVDTITMFIGKDAIEKSMEDNPRVAGRANTIKRFLEKIISAQNAGGVMNPNPVTIVCNSQVRTKGIGAYRTFLGTSDGNMMDHCVALDLYFREKGFTFENKEYASYGEYEFTVLKNHVGGSSGVAGTFKIWLDPLGPYQVGDTDDFKHVVNYGRQYGLIKGSTGKYNIECRHVDEGVLFRTVGALETFLQENKTVFLDLRRRVLEKVIQTRTPTKAKDAK
jgi:RecA/RadA recombinase